MFRNYLKIALRNFKRHKGYSILNVAGLAFGMACSILILLWVRDETSYDRFHANAGDIYRVLQEVKFSDHETTWAATQGPLGPGLEKDFPEIVRAVRIRDRRCQVRQGDVWVSEWISLADPSIFKMFTFPLAAGDPDTALADPRSIVLSEETAARYFPDGDVLGRTLRVDDRFDFRVTGVMKPVPRNSHLQFDFIVPFVFGREVGLTVDAWNNTAFTTYVELRKGTPAAAVVGKIANYLDDKPTVEKGTRLALQPLKRIHLHSNYEFDAPHGDIRYVRIFSLVAFFILLIACINFMNLTTARSAGRAREVGMRKVSGARRADIVGQFYGESVLLILVALLLAVALAKLLLPAFNNLAAKELQLDLLRSPGLLGGLAGLALVTAVIAGSYPAFFLSAFRPARVLKAGPSSGARGRGFRRALVVVQFSLTILLVICTVFVYGQLNFMRNSKLGYDKENVIYMSMRGEMRKDFEAVKTELLRSPAVLGVGAGEMVPTYGYTFSNSLWTWAGQSPDDEILIRAGSVGEGYLEVLGVEMAQGRTFVREPDPEKNPAFIINEEAARVMKMKDPVGQWLSDRGGHFKGTIVGVVKDYHFTPLRQRIEPLVLVYYPPDCNLIVARLKPGDIPRTIGEIEKVWKKFAPGFPFRFNFLDEALDELYRSEERTGTIIGYFAFLAVVVSCLGLFGLASFTAERRTKEIGIRKVLGATGPTIAWLFSREFSRWVLAANVIAWPAAYFAVSKWLEGYPYRISIGPGPFLFAGGLALAVAALTVGYHSVRSARANPSGALRYE
jgi:putative ABC transport system permease protein